MTRDGEEGEEKERETARRDLSKYYLGSGTASSGWCPTSAGCNASRFRSRSSFTGTVRAELICPAVKERDDTRQRERRRTNGGDLCALMREPPRTVRTVLITRTDRSGTSTNDGQSGDGCHYRRRRRRVSYVTYQSGVARRGTRPAPDRVLGRR